MSGFPTLVVVCAGCLASSLAAGLLHVRQRDREAVFRQRLAGIRQSVDLPLKSGQVGPSLTSVVAGLGRMLAQSGLLPAGTLAELEETLGSAAVGGANGLAMFIGFKMLLLLGLPALTFLVVSHWQVRFSVHVMLAGLSGVLGLLGPDYVIGRWRNKYLRSVESGLPDALDMMVICSEAGLGLEMAIDRVAEEIGQAHPSIAREFRTTAHEMRLTSDRRQVLLNMGERTRLENLRRLATTLIQTIQFGTPLSQALRTLAVEMRQDNMTKYEARAAKLPVVLTFPMILFILPCVFIVVGGPAALEAMRMMSKH